MQKWSGRRGTRGPHAFLFLDPAGVPGISLRPTEDSLPSARRPKGERLMKRPATAFRLTLAAGLCCVLGAGWAAGEAQQPPQGVKVASDLDQRLAKYAPTEMGFDARTLSEKDHRMLRHLVAAASQID